ncbi:hypothetical protein [Dactylosporangium sp. CS-033363]|uniref:hypothetical protein n=1 Tax=Dactylosporangium sp. CS-033363 TaxID=3239935 RepID=UPI003D90759B
MSARRKRLAVVLGALALVAVVVESVAAANPWRYVALIPAGKASTTVLVATGVVVLVGVGAALLIRRTLAAQIAVGVTLVVAWLVACAGLEAAGAGVERGATTSVAVSPDGRFELVLVHYPQTGNPIDYLRLRTRSGLGSRESADNVACFSHSYEVNAPEDVFERAAFVGEHEVEVRAEQGEPFRTTFAPDSLRAAAAWSRGCDA